MKTSISTLIHSFLSNPNHVASYNSGMGLLFSRRRELGVVFPKLNFQQEELYLTHENRAGNFDFALSSKFLYVLVDEPFKLPVWEFNDMGVSDRYVILEKVVGASAMELVELIRAVSQDLPEPQVRTNLNKLVEAFQTITRKGKKEDMVVDRAFLKLVQEEGDKMVLLCGELNKDANFQKEVKKLCGNDDKQQKVKAQDLMLHDISMAWISLFESREKNEKHFAKCDFLLAHCARHLQTKVFATPEQRDLQTLVGKKELEKVIRELQNANDLKIPNTYKEEYLLPIALQGNNTNQFNRTTTFLFRIATLFAKSDGQLSASIEQVLSDIKDKIHHPKQEKDGIQHTEVNDEDSLEKVMEELNSLIGLKEIKDAVQDLTNFLRVQQLRKDLQLKTANNALHSVFMGPPGTGKTTVARLVGRIFKHLGFLKSGHLIETDRSGVVAGYIGQTATKMDEVVKSALGGVLFIDEAYSLANPEDSKDFGHEAVEILLKRMEDHRDEFVVIVAGYPTEMKDFIRTNPGLQSRFNRYFTFEHYPPQALLDIFKLFARKADFQLTAVAEELLKKIFTELYDKRTATFGNARVARNLFEQIIEQQANRIVGIKTITKEILMTITKEDIPPLKETVNEFLHFGQDQEINSDV